MKEYIKIHPNDLVAVALCPISAGRQFLVEGVAVTLRENIPQGHKFAVKDIWTGDQIIKYGAPIGTAVCDIPAGAWVHVHNVKTNLEEHVTYTYQKAVQPLPAVGEASFMGFRRKDGRVGVRNELWIIPTVGCVNSVAEAIARDCGDLAAGTVDAVVALTHPYGCSQMDQDQENTRKILADLINHPNAGGVLVLGLGCENSSIEVLKPYIGEYDPDRVKFLECQQAVDERADACQCMRELAAYAGTFWREKISCSELVVGVKCGGSDGLSGITANPTVGAFSDLLIAQGGTTVLTEVPEMFGAEHLLMSRCVDRACFDKTVRLIENFKAYFISCGQTIYENPSPGNKAGGITTLEDKSLGCTQKSGGAPVVDVLDYGQQAVCRGLNLLSAPGNDLVSSTALAASGAQIVLFTTGRGTPFASPVPTVKISSNSALFEGKTNWMDFDAGTVVYGETIEETTRRLFEYVVQVASGELVKAEKAGYHGMAIFKQGVTL